MRCRSKGKCGLLQAGLPLPVAKAEELGLGVRGGMVPSLRRAGCPANIPLAPSHALSWPVRLTLVCVALTFKAPGNDLRSY